MYFWPGGPKYRHFCCAATRPCTRVETSQPVFAALTEPLSPPPQARRAPRREYGGATVVQKYRYLAQNGALAIAWYQKAAAWAPSALPPGRLWRSRQACPLPHHLPGPSSGPQPQILARAPRPRALMQGPRAQPRPARGPCIQHSK